MFKENDKYKYAFPSGTMGTRKKYLRYVDDFIIFGDTKEELLGKKGKIELYLENNFKYKKARYLDEYEKQKGDMNLDEIKKFLSVLASFEGHIKHANSYNLKQKVGIIDDEKYMDNFFNK